MMVMAALLLNLVIAPMPQASMQRPPVPTSDTVIARLDEMVQTAMQRNLRLRAATAETDGARAYGTIARSRFDPVLNVGGDTETNGVGGQVVGLLPTGASYLMGSVAPTTLPGEPLYPNALVATVSQPLLRGFGLYSARSAIRATDAGIAAARARLSWTRAEVAATVRMSYAMLVERHRQEAIATGSLRRAQELRDAYTELRALDKITRVDLNTAQLGVASRHATLLEAQRARREAEDALRFAVYGADAAALLARGDVVLFPVDTAISVPSIPVVDVATQTALGRRADIAAAREEAVRSRYQVQFARNALLPTLNLYAAFTSTLTGAPLGGSLATRETRIQDQSFGIMFSRPLVNSGARAERERAAAAQSQAEIALADAENTVRAEVRSTHRDIEVTRQQVEMAAEASRLAREQYQDGRERLNLGLTDIFRVLQYDEQVARLESLEASARLALASAVARYRLAVGD
jgi:outer membrane protein TolC